MYLIESQEVYRDDRTTNDSRLIWRRCDAPHNRSDNCAGDNKQPQEPMSEYYTLDQAMERLGIHRKYPQVFVHVNPHNKKSKKPWYDKAALDEFAKNRELLKQELP